MSSSISMATLQIRRYHIRTSFPAEVFLRWHSQLHQYIPIPQPFPIVDRTVFAQPRTPQHTRRRCTSLRPFHSSLSSRDHHQPILPHEQTMRTPLLTLLDPQRILRLPNQLRINLHHPFPCHSLKPLLKPMRKILKRHRPPQPLLHKIPKRRRRPPQPLKMLMHPTTPGLPPPIKNNIQLIPQPGDPQHLQRSLEVVPIRQLVLASPRVQR